MGVRDVGLAGKHKTTTETNSVLVVDDHGRP